VNLSCSERSYFKLKDNRIKVKDFERRRLDDFCAQVSSWLKNWFGQARKMRKTDSVSFRERGFFTWSRNCAGLTPKRRLNMRLNKLND
jgi:hypothetical protein